MNSSLKRERIFTRNVQMRKERTPIYPGKEWIMTTTSLKNEMCPCLEESVLPVLHTIGIHASMYDVRENTYLKSKWQIK